MMFYPVARRRILAVEGGLREQCAGVCASWFGGTSRSTSRSQRSSAEWRHDLCSILCGPSRNERLSKSKYRSVSSASHH